MALQFEDRDYVKRYYRTNIDEYLSAVHGRRYIKYRKEWEKTERRNGYVPKYPLEIIVELTSYCNLDCVMCVNRFSSPDRIIYNVPMELIDNLANQCKEIQVPAIALGLNAEPTLHPDYKEIVRRFKEVAVDLWAYTNGVKLTEQLANYLVDLRVERLLVSLDAAKEETYKKIRGGNLRTVEKNIHRFLSIKKGKNTVLPFLRLSYVKMKENLGEIDLFLEKWRDYADIIDFQDYIDCSNINNPKPIVVAPFICPHPFQRLSLNWNGDIYPCCAFYSKHFKLGNLNNMTITEAWNSDKIKKLRASFFHNQIHPACQNCYGNLKFREQHD